MVIISALEALTRNQALIYEALIAGKNAVTIVVGPAGTGKTRLSLSAAAVASKRDRKEIVYTRPLVSPGGSLGYLPGDVRSKMAPYVSHILEDSRDVIPTKTIETRPLQTMRGTTFKDTFVVADEMQNATIDQAKMLLTRVGRGSRVVLVGDEDQSDLAGVRESGLAYFARAVREVEEGTLAHVRLFELTREDIVRSDAVREILDLTARTRPL